MRRFAKLDLFDDALPDETTILHFRHLLERHELTKRMFEIINEVLKSRGLLLKGGRWMRPLFMPLRRPRIRHGNATRRCTRRRRAINTTLG
jgi:IS5 family transposase